MQDITKIIASLKKYPRLNLREVAKIMNLDVEVVAQAQRDYLKPYIKRNSPLWGDDNSRVKYS